MSLIIQEDEETKPWLCSKSTGFLTMEEAYKEIKFMREHDRVLSAWIDIYDNEEKENCISRMLCRRIWLHYTKHCLVAVYSDAVISVVFKIKSLL